MGLTFYSAYTERHWEGLTGSGAALGDSGGSKALTSLALPTLAVQGVVHNSAGLWKRKSGPDPVWCLVRRGVHPPYRGREPSQTRVAGPREKPLEANIPGKTHPSGHTQFRSHCPQSPFRGLGFKLPCQKQTWCHAALGGGGRQIRVEEQPQLHSEFEASLGFRSPCLRKEI